MTPHVLPPPTSLKQTAKPALEARYGRRLNHKMERARVPKSPHGRERPANPEQTRQALYRPEIHFDHV